MDRTPNRENQRVGYRLLIGHGRPQSPEKGEDPKARPLQAKTDQVRRNGT